MKKNRLAENKNVRQRPEEGFRRWFLDHYFDLIVWYNNDMKISGFQICYNKYGNQKAITWQDGNVFSHRYVTTGVREKRSSILNRDAGEISPKLIKKFFEHAENIEKDLIEFIHDKILEKIKR